MKLIGMLDSPYVRRVAISLQLLNLKFEHESLSVFSTFDEFRKINPVVKAPTLLFDDGKALMDSSLILQYAEAIAAPRSLYPTETRSLEVCLRQVGLALAACEKCVQIVYEKALRPAEKIHQPWIDRVKGQLLAALDKIEEELSGATAKPLSVFMSQAEVSIAVAWRFIQEMVPDVVSAARYPSVATLSFTAEKLPEFIAAPHGASVYRSAA